MNSDMILDFSKPLPDYNRERFDTLAKKFIKPEDLDMSKEDRGLLLAELDSNVTSKDPPRLIREVLNLLYALNYDEDGLPRSEMMPYVTLHHDWWLLCESDGYRYNLLGVFPNTKPKARIKACPKCGHSLKDHSPVGCLEETGDHTSCQCGVKRKRN